MVRISGVDPKQQGFWNGLFTRVIYAMTKRKVGRVVMPVKIAAHHPKILWGYGQMEQSLFSSKLLDAGLKNLANCAWPRWSAALFEWTSVLRSAEEAASRLKKSQRCPATEAVRCFRRRRSWCWNMPTA